MIGDLVGRNRRPGDPVAIAKPLEQVAILASGAAEWRRIFGRNMAAYRAIGGFWCWQASPLRQQIRKQAGKQNRGDHQRTYPAHQEQPGAVQLAVETVFLVDQPTIGNPADKNRDQ